MDSILSFDLCILDFIQSTLRCSFLDFVMPYITLLGEDGILWIVLGITLCIIKKTRPMGTSVLIALAVGFLVCNLTLKPLVARVRPYDLTGFTGLLIEPLADFSFPSGHTIASFEMAVCVYSFNKKYGIFALITAALVGFSRLYLYVHYPTDVIAGAVFGIIIGWVVSSVIKKKYHTI